MAVWYDRFSLPDYYHSTRNFSVIVGSTVATTIAILAIARIALYSPSTKVILSPRNTSLPRLKESEKSNLPYPPDAFPGARDVDSPYGTIRIYEWGPESGRKVLFLHGISTPCISLGDLAHGLVGAGCRVILMDLFGRGYSDSPDLPHDPRLYSTQVLIAVTSSSIPWTPDGFSIVGYSLGGGIAVDFATSFPGLVKGLVLLAPGGLIRNKHSGLKSRLLYKDWMPDRVIEFIVGRRLRGNSSASSTSTLKNENPLENSDGDTEEGSIKIIVSAEVKGNRDPDFEGALLSKTRPGVTVGQAIQWQVESHEGFVRSFVSSIRYSSIFGCNETWKKLANRSGKILIMAGETDSVVVPEELKEDCLDAVGGEKIEWRIVKGAGHEFAITRSDEIIQEIRILWGL